jgi:hypothetical protein
VILRISQLLQLGDDRDGVVGHQAADVEELVPEVAVEPVVRVVRAGTVAGSAGTSSPGVMVSMWAT